MRQPAKRLIALCLIPVMLFNTLAVQPAMAGFGIDTLIRTGIKGMFDPDCGGYCIVGACAHLVIKISLSGIEIYTIISPKLRHAVPDMVVSAYNHPGNEPWDEWRASFGTAVNIVNHSVIATLLGTPDGLQGGRSDRRNQDEHQSVSFKEVDVVGHPASLIPRILTSGARSIFKEAINIRLNLSDSTQVALSSLVNRYRIPSASFLPKSADATAVDAQNPNSEFNLSAMLNTALTRTLQTIRKSLIAFLNTLDILAMIDRIIALFDTLKDLMTFYNNAMTLLETFTRGSIYGNLINPRFRATRIFCPTNVLPFQPYYLSYADALFWRTGFPITDGPISGANHSLTILNPLSTDKLGSGLEVWGHLYPREGTVNSNHDAKTASVAAWRGYDVVKTDAGKGRIGVPPPLGYDTGSETWQMIYPVERSCAATPYYPDDGLGMDFMQTNEEGSYAWNVYHVYECCANTRGTKILEVPLPVPLCLELPGIN